MHPYMEEEDGQHDWEQNVLQDVRCKNKTTASKNPIIFFAFNFKEMYIMSKEIFDATHTSKPCLKNSTVDRYGNA